ncbi:two-component system response regulator YesN [Paenibacillus phyllosphaerae]|uniref:Two-component system response regulator YesN n=1 Tax=Paenibacillus phyllosphaerae TaxID=274593 RepID=A0A7W5AZB6_9BACL|nr:response regulator [Paenibacillus phyllosphaerae]MBB3111529.1 two-component system response regulator YesN [Paenibacillus phyllosphaerae]
MNRNSWKMCVIDDVVAVIDGISKSVKWQEHDIQLAGTATDGEEGLKLIEEVAPDIIITDIRMPKLDGMALTEQVKSMLPNCKIIFITGFTDFEYAQQALKLGAFDFLAKPFSLDEIVEAVRKATGALEEERREDLVRLELERKVKASLPILRQEYFQLLLHHRGGEEHIWKRWDFLEIPLAKQKFAVMVLEIDEFAEKCEHIPIHQAESQRFSLQNIVEETISGYTKGIVFRETMDRFVAVFNENAHFDSLMLAEKCCQNIQQHTRFTVSIGLGLGVDKMNEIAGSYEQAIAALSYHFYTGGNGVFGYHEVNTSEIKRPYCSADMEKELLYSIRSGNSHKASELFMRIFADFAGTDDMPDPEYFVSFYYEMAYTMIRVLLEIVSREDAAELVRSVRERNMAGLTSLSKMQEKLLQLCWKICEMIERSRASEASVIIESSVRYIREHLHEELTVQSQARHVHLSGSYYANLFKKTMGLPFAQFVTQERMELAKKMLVEGHQVQEIAIATGYGDRRYFSEVFKKHIGITPSEFKLKYWPG